MKLNIHPEFQRAMQAARQEEISHTAARQRAKGNPNRSAWAVRLVRAVTAGVAAGRLVFAEKAAA